LFASGAWPATFGAAPAFGRPFFARVSWSTFWSNSATYLASSGSASFFTRSCLISFPGGSVSRRSSSGGGASSAASSSSTSATCIHPSPAGSGADCQPRRIRRSPSGHSSRCTASDAISVATRRTIGEGSSRRRMDESGRHSIARAAAAGIPSRGMTAATARSLAPGAEALLGREVPVLDRGFVQAIDYMGTDEDIVQAARVSYGPSTRKLHDDRGLLRYLMRHRHTTPFEMCEVKFRCKMPIFVARQWIRHRTANVNEMSLRYSEAPDEFYVPGLEAVTLQSTTNKQGRDDAELPAALREQVRALLRARQDEVYADYQRLAGELGIARELARTVLPVSLYTQWIWKIDLHNLLHFLDLRLDPHAQLEIRAFAEAMAAFVRAWVPLAWEAFVDYRREALPLSRLEARAIGRMLAGAAEPDAAEDAGLRGRELQEFAAKLARMRALAG
jgi:thymidylate synthase (FAD)